MMKNLEAESGGDDAGDDGNGGGAATSLWINVFVVR